MTPVLFPYDAKSWGSNGLGKLSDLEDCTVIEALSNKFEFEMKYPVKGLRFGKIKPGAIILAEPAPWKEPEPFRIYRITKPMSGRVMVYAKHLAYDLEGITTDAFSIAGPELAFKAIKDNASVDCPFTFHTDIESTNIIGAKVPTSIWTILGSSKGCMLDVFGGEYLFNRYNISLLKSRGEDRGVVLKYGKNLTSLEQDENVASCYTAVHPYWTDSDGALVQLPEKVVKCDGTYGYTRVLTLDLSKVFEEKPTADKIRDYVSKYIAENDIGKPKTSWKISYVQLEQTDEYKNKRLFDKVYIGDTVSIEYPELGVSAKAKVREVRYKPMLRRYESITLGDVKPNMASTIARKPDKAYADMAAMAAVDSQTQLDIFNKLTCGGTKQGLFVDDDGNVCTNLTYARAGTLDAKIVKVKNLSAGSTNTGRLAAVDGMSYFDLDTGEFASIDENQNATKIKGGEIILQSSAGVNQLYITRSKNQCNVWICGAEGEFVGGIGSLEGKFLIYAPDGSLDAGAMGRPVIWKNVNGENMIVAASSLEVEK